MQHQLEVEKDTPVQQVYAQLKRKSGYFHEMELEWQRDPNVRRFVQNVLLPEGVDLPYKYQVFMYVPVPEPRTRMYDKYPFYFRIASGRRTVLLWRIMFFFKPRQLRSPPHAMFGLLNNKNPMEMMHWGSFQGLRQTNAQNILQRLDRLEEQVRQLKKSIIIS